MQQISFLGGASGLCQVCLQQTPAVTLKRCEYYGVIAICRHANEWPNKLNDLHDPPRLLYLKGETAINSNGMLIDLNLIGPAVAIVGARVPTEQAAELTKVVASELASSGICVISGMAFGIDGAAHLGALKSGVTAPTTIAVLGGGVERASPARMQQTYERIVGSGLVISEYPPSSPPSKYTFPARNRIIAALADVVVVVEAAAKSGSLITVDHALDLGRTVAAFPGFARNPKASGTNALLKEPAAEFVTSAKDVLELFKQIPIRNGHYLTSQLPFSAEKVTALPDNEQTVGTRSLVLEQLRMGNDSMAGICASLYEASAIADELVKIEIALLEAEGLISRTLDGRLLEQALVAWRQWKELKL